MNAALALLSLLWGEVRRRPGPALAAVAAMTTGTAVFVAIQLAGSAARSSFISAMEAVAGRATHQVTAANGLAEERLPAFADLPNVEAFQPIIEGRALIRAVRPKGDATREKPLAMPPLHVLGIDPFFAPAFVNDKPNEPVVQGENFTRFLLESGAAVLPKNWAAEAGLSPGDVLIVSAAGRTHEIKVLGFYELSVLREATRDTALVDLSSAQEIFGKRGRIDRIDFILKDGGEAAVSTALGPGEQLGTPASRGGRVARLIDAFRLNLLALGALALVVGAILVFNASHFLVVRRAALLGQLRCLGTSRPMLLSAIVLESAFLGALGGALGLGLGVLLAQGLVGPLSQTITNLYSFVRVEVAPLDALTACGAIAGAALIAAFAALLPAFDAAHTPPRLVGVRSRSEARFRGRLGRMFALGLIATLAGGGLAAYPTDAWWPGMAAALSFLLAAACWMPALMGLLLPRLQKFGERTGRLILPLAAGALNRSLTRTGGAAAALAVALAMTIGVSVMVSSFEKEVRRWIGVVVRADIFVSDEGESTSRETARIPEEAVSEIERMPTLRALDTLRGLEVPYRDGSFFFAGAEMATQESRERFEFLEGSVEESIPNALSGGVIISEPLAQHYGLKNGDTLIVPGLRNEERFEIAGVIRDFSYDRGYALTGKTRFIAAFGDSGIRNVAIFVQPGTDPQAAADWLRKAFAGRYALSVRSNAELRARVMEVFDQTFAVTYLLQTIAAVLALCGIAVTLLGLFLERIREIATLRALGAAANWVGRVFAGEALLLALFPALVALPLGAVLAWILIHVINLRCFGWTIPFNWPWGPVLATCALSTLAGLSASLLPLFFARRLSISAALREE